MIIKTNALSLLLAMLQGLLMTTNGQPVPIKLADPTIFTHNGIYYLYGTGGRDNNGFEVYTSPDLEHWSGPAGATDGYALKKGDAFGDKGFWAPQVFEHQGKFYMAYTANEQIAIAVSDHPLGPFRQERQLPLSGPGKQIDPFIFRDDDGSLYLYHVRLTEGNRIYVARLKPDLTDVDTATAMEVLYAEAGWENTQNRSWPVAEGPTVIKQKGKYLLFYSANDFRNPDYAVGYATSESPFGPWTKAANGPIINKNNTGIKGTGHGDILAMPDGAIKYVLHTHQDSASVGPRLTGIIDLRIRVSKKSVDISAVPGSFHYLTISKPVATKRSFPRDPQPFKEGQIFPRDGIIPENGKATRP